MRRFRIALTGTLGVLGNRLARHLDADESCGRVVLLDLAPPALELRKARYYRIGRKRPLRTFNVGGKGTVPLHPAIRLCRRRPVPLLRFAAVRLFDALFPAIAPSAHLGYLPFACVVDGQRAHVELGFAPRHSIRDTLVEHGRTQLRDAA